MSAQLLKMEAAGQRLGVGRTTVYALVKAGELQSIKIGRLRLVPESAIEAYIAAAVSAQCPAPVDRSSETAA